MNPSNRSELPQLPEPVKHKPNELTLYFSELFREATTNQEHPLHSAIEKFYTHLADVTDRLDIGNQEKQLTNAEKAITAITNQWLADQFHREIANPQINPQLFPLLLALARLEHFIESPQAIYLRQLISGAYAHARLSHTLVDYRKDHPEVRIFQPNIPQEDVTDYPSKQLLNLEIARWELAGVDIAFYNLKTKTLYLLDAKGSQQANIPTSTPKNIREKAQKVAQEIIQQHELDTVNIVHLEIQLPVPNLRDNHPPTLEQLPPEQQEIIYQMLQLT